MKDIALIACSLLAVLTAALSFTRRSLVHGGLLLVVSWMGIAGLYFVLGAEFLALAQMLVYVGAVSMVVLFAVVMTQPAVEQAKSLTQASLRNALSACACVAPVLAFIVAVARSVAFPDALSAPLLTVRDLGLSLMREHSVPLLLVGVLLTSALIGAMLLAAPDEKEDSQ